MSIPEKYRLSGPAETIQRLQRFRTAFRRKVLRQVGRAGSQALKDEIRPAIPTAKKDYGRGGSLRKSFATKISIYQSGLSLWFGYGPRTGWRASVTKLFRFWRDKRGRLRKAPIAWQRAEQPSRRTHLSERRVGFIRGGALRARSKIDRRAAEVFQKAFAEV